MAVFTSTQIPEQRLLDDGGVFPLVLAPSRGTASAEQAASWWEENNEELRGMALRHGAVLFRGGDIRSAQDFAALSSALDCAGYDYVGGAAPRTELVQGVVFTSNESPPDQPIPFHHELAQAPNPPHYIMFFCEKSSEMGGATPIVHSVEVAEFVQRVFPDCFQKLREKGVRYIRVMPEETDVTSAQGRSWKETYNATSREQAEAAMKKQGTTPEWLPNGDCRTTTAVLPAIRTDHRVGRFVFFNQVIAAFTGWNDSRNVGERAVVFGDGSPMPAEALRAIAGFMQEHSVAFKWQDGDVLLIDNGLVQHARESFVPPRRVLASLRGPPIMKQPRRAYGTRRISASKSSNEMAATPFRVGILGAGMMGMEHVRNIALLGEHQARVVAVAEPDAELRELVTNQLPEGCVLLRSPDRIIETGIVDAIIVATPNYQHIHDLRKAIPTNKHILCEKPLCTTMADCLEVEQLLKEREEKALSDGVTPGVFMTGMEYRWMPPIARLIAEVDSGNLGGVHLLTIREHRFPFLLKVNNWNRFNRFTGGTLVEKACHFFDLMRRIAGSDPVSVFASGGQAVNHKDEVVDGHSPDILDHALVVVDFANGLKASLDLCMFAEDEQSEHVIAVCERGKVEAKTPESTVRVVRRNMVTGKRREPPAPHERAKADVVTIPVEQDLLEAGHHEGATFFELQSFLDAALGKIPVPVSAHDGRMAVAMGLAAHESISLGRVVHVEHTGETIPALQRIVAELQHVVKEAGKDQPMSRL